jgi:hypothetical protein
MLKDSFLETERQRQRDESREKVRERVRCRPDRVEGLVDDLGLVDLVHELDLHVWIRGQQVRYFQILRRVDGEFEQSDGDELIEVGSCARVINDIFHRVQGEAAHNRTNEIIHTVWRRRGGVRR